jgi:hypothetical protein
MSQPPGLVRPEGLGKLKIFIHFIRFRTRHLPAYSLVPQPTNYATVDFHLELVTLDRLYGLVVRVLDYKSRGSRSIPGATRFPEKQ